MNDKREFDFGREIRGKQNVGIAGGRIAPQRQSHLVKVERITERLTSPIYRGGKGPITLGRMRRRNLGKTGLSLPILSFGASSLGQEFRDVALDDAIQSPRTALDCGMNLIDTSPFYGRGMSEVLLGIALRGIRRDSYLLSTKLGRYDRAHFDFSARRVAESIDVSLHRLGTDYLDIVLCHDIEFVPLQQVVEETLPALRTARDAGVFTPVVLLSSR